MLCFGAEKSVIIYGFVAQELLSYSRPQTMGHEEHFRLQMS